MARGGEPVAVKAFDVDGHVRHALAGVEHDASAHLARLGDDVLHRVEAPEDVGDMRHAHELGARGEEGAEVLQVIGHVGAEAHKLDHSARARRHHLPRDDVCVVLHFRKDDLVALLEVARAPAVGHQVDGVGRPAREDDFRALGVDELCHLFARAFVQLRRLHSQGMRTAVHIRVALAVVRLHGVEDLDGLLARRCAVEVDERLAVHALGEQREVLAHLRPQALCRRHGCYPQAAAGTCRRAALAAKARRVAAP